MSKLVDGLFVKSFKAIVNSTKSQQNVQQTNEKNKIKEQQRKSTTMNEVIVEKPYTVNYLRSPPAGRRQPFVVNNEDPKKRETKKWSFSSFFRRRKKSIESESSSQEDLSQYNTRRSFMSRKKKSTKKSEKPKKKLVGAFDHIVIPPKTGEYYNCQDGGIMSDPSGDPYNAAYMRRESNLLHNHQNIFASIHKPYSGSVETSKSSRESLNAKPSPNTPLSRNESASCNGSYGSLDSSSKKRSRERAQQRRDRLLNDYHSSSDEGSQRSTASSLIRLKSDSDSGTKVTREVSVNRKTRSARTERYIKRLSREDEHILNKEAEIVKGHYLQRQASVSPVVQQQVAYLSSTHNNSSLPNYSGCGRPCPQQFVYRKPPLSGSYVPHPHENNSTYIPRNANSHNDIYGKIWSHQDNHSINSEIPVLSLQRTTPDSYYMPKKKSWSLENNIHRSSPINSQTSNLNTNESYTCYVPPNYTSPRPYVRSPPQPYINSTYQKCTVPPPPPPRDPQRRVIPPNLSNGYDSFQRPMSYAFETNNQRPSSTSTSQTTGSVQPTTHQLNPANTMSVDRNSSIRSINSVNYPPTANGEPQNPIYMNHRSNSDDHIIPQSVISEPNRPASVNPELMMNGNVTQLQQQQPQPQKRYITRNRSNPSEQTRYQFFTDQVPRSRKPIHIVPIQNDNYNQYLSDSQVDFKYKQFSNEECRSPKIQSVTEFWKQKEKEEAERRAEAKQMKKNIRSPKIDEQNSTRTSSRVTSATSSPMNSLPRNTENVDKSTQSSPKNLENTSNISSPYNSLKRRESNSFRPLSMVLEKPENEKLTTREPPVPPVRRSSRQSSTSSTEMATDWLVNESNTKKSVIETKPTESPIPAPRKSLMQNCAQKVDQNITEPAVKEEMKTQPRKSTNLEDALNELEEIYKSLQLGDEDLLDRAERRDIPTFKGKLAGASEVDGKLDNDKCSTSSSMESFMDEVALPRRKHISRRSAVPDKTTDDMAYRKMHRNDLSPSISSPKDSALSQVSYLLASPDLSLAPTPEIPDQPPSNNKEPDIELDDVVYRNLKHANSTLKVIEPQPPFGIPIGPVTTAPSSDYLHAKPENRPRSRFIPQKIPDIVKDDLAFRSLRKDTVKDPLLPDDFKPNLTGYNSHPLDMRKKRAIRSLSANLYNIIQRECVNQFNPITMEKTSSLTNMDEVGQVKPTKKLSDLPTSSETLVGSQNNVLSDSEVGRSVEHRLRVYIPKGGNQESDTDIEIRVRKSTSPRTFSAHATPLSKSPEPNFEKSEFETLLINLAKETQEESKKLEIELEELSNETAKQQAKSESAQKLSSSKKLNVEKTITDINNVSEHAKLCEKLLECVVESTDLISSKIPEPESEASKEDEKSVEKPKDVNEGKIKNESLSEIIADIDNVSEHAQLCNKLLECVVESTELVTPKTPIIIEKSTIPKNDALSQENHKHLNVLECVVESTELIPIKPEMIKISDVENSVDEGVVELDEENDHMPKVATATELTTDENDTVELFNPINVLESSVANVIFLGRPDSPSEVTLDYVDSDRLSLIKSDDYENLDEFITSTDLSDSNDTLELDGDKTPTEISNQNILESLITNQNIPFADTNNLSPATENISASQGSKVLTGKTKSGSCTFLSSSTTNSPPLPRPCTSTVSDDESPWYKDSKTLALACAYVLACTHQLASTDVITIIGIILAVISVLAALVM